MSSLVSAEGYRANRRTAGLVALFAVVIGGALLLRPEFVSSGVEPAYTGTSSSEQAATGAVWVIAEVILAGGILVGLLCWRRLPEWLQESISPALRFAAVAFIGAYALSAGQLWLGIGTGFTFIFMSLVTDKFGVWWAINDLLAIGIAIFVAAAVGITLGPVILAVGLVGLTVYDYIFADRADWMFNLAAWTIRRRIPTLFIVPTTARLQWDDLEDALSGESDGDDPDELIGWAIGMGDLLLPAAFAVSLVDAGGLVVHGAVAGTFIACARVSWKMEQGAGAGLPPLVSGALGGWGVAALVGVMLA